MSDSLLDGGDEPLPATVPAVVPAAAPKVNRLPDGRFVPGHSLPGPGRKKQPTLRRIVEARQRRGEIAIDDCLSEVFDALMAAARSGDTAAAKILLDHLVDREQQLDVGLSLRVVTGADS